MCWEVMGDGEMGRWRIFHSSQCLRSCQLSSVSEESWDEAGGCTAPRYCIALYGGNVKILTAHADMHSSALLPYRKILA